MREIVLSGGVTGIARSRRWRSEQINYKKVIIGQRGPPGRGPDGKKGAVKSERKRALSEHTRRKRNVSCRGDLSWESVSRRKRLMSNSRRERRGRAGEEAIGNWQGKEGLPDF